VAQIDDLVEPRPEHILLTTVPTLLRPHHESLPSPSPTAENHASDPDSIRKIAPFSTAQTCKIEYFHFPANAQNQRVSAFFTDDEFAPAQTELI